MTLPSPVTILGVPVHPVTMAAALAHLRRCLTGDRLCQVCTPNPEFVMHAQRDAAFMAVLQAADLNIPDGIGLVWAGRRLGRPMPQRVAGSDLVYELAALCAAERQRLFLLGAAPGVAERAAAALKARYPGLTIAGAYAGSPAEAENDAIVARINAAAADVLYVAYGAPQQDLWIARNRDALPTVRVALGVGGALDFIAGDVPRAPRWVRRIHLEWLYRLLLQPWRWRRMLALPRFVLAVWRADRA